MKQFELSDVTSCNICISLQKQEHVSNGNVQIRSCKESVDVNRHKTHKKVNIATIVFGVATCVIAVANGKHFSRIRFVVNTQRKVPFLFSYLLLTSLSESHYLRRYGIPNIVLQNQSLELIILNDITVKDSTKALSDLIFNIH